MKNPHLLVAWQVETAKDSEIPLVPVLLDAAKARGFKPGVAVLDRGYDTQVVYQDAEGGGIRPVIPLACALAATRAIP